MVGPKKPDPETGLPTKPNEPPNQSFQFWNQTLRAGRGRSETGWCKRKKKILGNSLRDQLTETGETYEKELASAERMKRGYFNK